MATLNDPTSPTATIPADLADAATVAKIVGVCGRTLMRWREVQAGPAFYRLGPRRIRYSLADVQRWMAQQRAAGH